MGGDVHSINAETRTLAFRLMGLGRYGRSFNPHRNVARLQPYIKVHQPDVYHSKEYYEPYTNS
ncbi:hypothetical protein BSFA1_84020 (plasmid) [Burkholderia sp. SFA1]|nr:hypothetical protein BSFA1_84020 [Burkholderia sp. SFA1]